MKSVAGKNVLVTGDSPVVDIKSTTISTTFDKETLANLPPILRNAAVWYKSFGTLSSPGTKVYTILGNVNVTGLIEVPMGITLRDIIFKIGGGVPKGKKFKAVQTGGPSGGCIPPTELDTPVDYESLSKLGSIMGSGGMIVMDENTCMVDLAKYFMEFIQSESCGKCVPCRVGSEKAVVMLEAARLLRTVPLKRGVLFAAFGGEEQGLFGSAACAEMAAAEAELLTRWVQTASSFDPLIDAVGDPDPAVRAHRFDAFLAEKRAGSA